MATAAISRQDATASLEQLLAWSREHRAYLHQALTFTFDQTTGISLKVKPGISTVPFNVPLLSCPYWLTISYLNAFDTSLFPSRGPKFPDSFLERQSTQTVSTFFLAQQFLLGRKSWWHDYIQALPQPDDLEGMGTALVFTADDLMWLQGTSLLEKTEQRRRSWQLDYEKAKARLKQEGFDVSGFTWQLILWAATIFSSRAFTSSLLQDVMRRDQVVEKYQEKILEASSKTFSVLIPVMDLTNHDPHVKMVWTQQYDDISLQSQELLGQGQEVYNNYGPKGNEELLMGFGFCLPENSWDLVSIKLHVNLSARQQEIKRRQKIRLKEDGILQVCDVGFHERRCCNHPFPRFSAFSCAIVNTLFITLANERETAVFEVDPDILFPPPTKSTPGSAISKLEPPPLLSTEALAQAEKRNPITNPRLIYAVTSELAATVLSIRSPLIDPSIVSQLGEPTNLKQNYAKMYRDGRLRLLTKALEPLLVTLQNGLTVKKPETDLLALETAMSMLDKIECICQYAELRSACTATLGTFDLTALRANGWEADLWTIWVLIVKAHFQMKHHLPPALRDWIRNICFRYELPMSTDTLEPSHNDLVDLFQKEAPLSDPENKWSFLGPDFITPDTIRWATKVVSQEGVWIAGGIVPDYASGLWVMYFGAVRAHTAVPDHVDFSLMHS